MISLILPPKDQISRAAKMLADEFGTASNIKSRVNRLSVLSAITSTQQRLKLFSKVPPNGLVIYCGTILTDDNKEKKVNIDFEPFKPINTSLYLCDNKFHTEVRRRLPAALRSTPAPHRPAPRAASTSSGRLHSLCCALAPPPTASPTARHLWCRIKAALTLALTLALAPDQALQELLESDDKFGFIVMDGNGSLFGTLAGNTREILHKFSV